VIDLDIRRSTCDEIICSDNPRNKPLVHSGFFNQYMSVRAPIYEAIDSMPDTKNIMIASHSLGAALGTIAALDLTLNRPHLKVTNITFGSPRVGNSEFSKLYDKHVTDSIRCVHGIDAVTLVPIPLRFCHVSQPLKLSRRGSMFDLLKPSTMIRDHNLDFYEEAINLNFSVENDKKG
jgi:hypothetical protein